MPIAEPFAAHVPCGCGWDVDEDADEKSPAGLLNPWNLRATDTLPNSRLPRPRIFPLLPHIHPSGSLIMGELGMAPFVCTGVMMMFSLLGFGIMI